MNSIDLRYTAERIFTIACNYPPGTYDRPPSVPGDERRLAQIEEELKEFQRQIGLWVTTNQ